MKYALSIIGFVCEVVAVILLFLPVNPFMSAVFATAGSAAMLPIILMDIKATSKFKNAGVTDLTDDDIQQIRQMRIDNPGLSLADAFTQYVSIKSAE
ncbi:hypothetical protein D2E26_0450 [Bifidobacterium dolichotidis]|uniref:Uncharacterized protein n=1 Tax=Bifidobacterium dolichotidis TaxID=2306976 RepID=A0A430FST1_9BIFI|nr:hypothetical protein [Bifidobacterium dolichotidis]RSX55887.1 hypothetical protein D2E26_0450 [Bifidobacterium dolichotidis]